MKPRNRRIYSADQEYLATIRAEYIMLGFDTSLDNGVLTVYALPRKRKKSKAEKKKAARNKRAESAARRQ